MKKILLLSFLLCTFTLTQAWSQDRSVSGKVTSAEDGGALPGVNVVLKGTTSGTVTDIDGNYKVNIPNDGAVLVYSFIGLESQEVEVGARSVIDVIMVQDAKQLSDVVVTAIGIERNKTDLSYSVATVDSEELTAGRAGNLLGSLQGKVPGAQIQVNGGNPGASTSIVLRGTSSFTNGNSNALIVIDGVPMTNTQLSAFSGQAALNGGNFFSDNTDAGNGIGDIDPENIETVTVLKGISAAAIYGSAATNGAIIITTKKGSGSAEGGISRISYTGSFSWDTPMRLPPVQTTFGLGQFGNNLEFINDQETWGDKYDGSLRPWSQIVDNQQLYKRYSATPGTLREAFDVGFTQRHNVNLSGGTDKANYFGSYSYSDQSGIVPNSGQEKHNMKLSGSAKLAHNVSVSGSAEFVSSENKTTPQGTGGNSDATFYGNLLRTSADIPTTESRDYTNKYQDVGGYFTPFNANPFRAAFTWEDVTNVNRVFGNFETSYKPLDWLTVTARVGGDFIYRQLEQYRPVERSGAPNNINRVGTFRIVERNDERINTDILIQVNKEISPDLKLTGVLGHNFRDSKATTTSAQQPALGIPGFRSLKNGLVQPVVDATFNQRRLVGVYGSAGLAYKGTYHLELTGRNDVSSTLPAANRSFFYYAVNGNIILSELIDVEFLSSLKVRGSYAEVGNDAPFNSITSNFLVELDPNVNDGRTTAFPFANPNAPGGGTLVGARAGNQIGAPDLQPERTKGFEIGLEAGILNERVLIDVAYYDQLSEEQIFNVDVSGTTGYTTSVANAGALRNKGVELQLTAIPLELNKFSWRSVVNFTKNRTTVESLAKGIDQFTISGFSSGGAAINTIAKPGEDYYLWEYTDYLKDPNGNLVVSPTTGLPQLDNSGNVTDGRSWQADFNMGFINTFTYGGLSLNVNFDIQKGGHFYSETYRQLETPGKAHSTTFNDRIAWIVPGSVLANADGTFSPNTSIFTADANQYWNNRNTGDYILKADYVKLREVSISYNLPKTLFRNIPINSASLTMFGRNLWIWTPEENPYSDPEQAAAFGLGGSNAFGGFEFGQIPSLRSMGFSIRLTL